MDELEEDEILTLLQSSDAESSSDDELVLPSNKLSSDPFSGDSSVWKAAVNLVNFIEGIGFLAVPSRFTSSHPLPHHPQITPFHHPPIYPFYHPPIYPFHYPPIYPFYHTPPTYPLILSPPIKLSIINCQLTSKSSHKHSSPP